MECEFKSNYFLNRSEVIVFFCIHIQIFIEQQAHDEALGQEDEMLMVQPPWRRPHHYWLMHQERKKRKRGKYLNVDARNIYDYILCK